MKRNVFFILFGRLDVVQSEWRSPDTKFKIVPDLGNLLDQGSTDTQEDDSVEMPRANYIVPYSKWIPVKDFEFCKDHEQIIVAKVVVSSYL